MGRPVSFDFTTGGGSPEEFLMGVVYLEPTLMHTIGSTVVIPDAPYPVKLVNGKAVHPDMAVSPAGPEPAWAYRVTIKNELTGKSWSELRGVPTGTTQIAYKDLTKFVTTIPPQTTAGMMQNWADTTEANADRSELAADRAEAPTDEMNKTLIENPESLTAGALSAAIAESVWDVPGPTGTVAGDTALVLAAALAAESAGRESVTMAPGHYLLDGVTVSAVKGRYLVGDNVTFSINSYVYPFRSDELQNRVAHSLRGGSGARIAFEVDDNSLSQWRYLFPLSKKLGITLGVAWPTSDGAQWIPEMHRHGWEIIAHLPDTDSAFDHRDAGTLDAACESSRAAVEAINGRKRPVFVYPEHARDDETDRICSKYFYRGRGRSQEDTYGRGEGYPWQVSSYSIDADISTGTLTENMKLMLNALAASGRQMVFYFHYVGMSVGPTDAALTALVAYARKLGIEIVNPEAIWAERDVFPDPYLSDPARLILGGGATLDSTRAYHGVRSVKVSSGGSTVTATVSGPTPKMTSIPSRAGFFGVFRWSTRYWSSAPLDFNLNQGIRALANLRGKRISGEALETIGQSFGSQGLSEPPQLPAGNWDRLQELVYFGPDVNSGFLGTYVAGLLPGQEVWIDEIKWELVDYVQSVEYRGTLNGIFNTTVYTNVPNLARYHVQVTPDNATAGVITQSVTAGMNLYVKSSDATDTMGYTVRITPKASYGSLALTGTGLSPPAYLNAVDIFSHGGENTPGMCRVARHIASEAAMATADKANGVTHMTAVGRPSGLGK